MGEHPALLDVRPTVCLKGPEDALRQMVLVRVGNPGPAVECTLTVGGLAADSVSLPHGESEQEAFIAAVGQAGEQSFGLLVNGVEVDGRAVPWRPAPHLRVHIVQHSHHDVGYTNLPSAVLAEHCGFLDSVIDMAEATSDYPDDARFRVVIEQAWALQEFLRRAPSERVQRMAQLLRQGDVELTALFGNMTTELCGHEELIRALYPSHRIAREFGFSITTAEHNDIPGMSWGLAQVLTAAGIDFFCPQLPRYWSWCDPPLQGFWDESVLFPNGRPGGFWWEAPSGGRVLLWDTHGTGGDARPDLPNLAQRLGELVERGYPYQAVYWPVKGGARDNAPYIVGFTETAREWNDQWTYPRLVISTNARFHAELIAELTDALPVFRGELPGQDYPVGSMSTAAATATNRANHTSVPAAEALSTLAAELTDHQHCSVSLDQAWEDTLWHDEHTWGHHFPCGPAAEASSLEKQVHAYRAAASAHDVSVRALARIADHIELPADGLYLVVYNPLPHPRTAAVVTPLREIENCGSVMAMVSDPDHPEQPGYLRGMALTDRWHLHPPQEFVDGNFDLIDLRNGAAVDFQIVDIAADAPVPHAPQRHGLARGGRRYGFFEVPAGLGRNLHFVAPDLPACGYATFELRPRQERQAAPAATPRSASSIENEYYRLEVDPDAGRIVSLIDIEADRELLDADAPHSLGEVVVRTPDSVLDGDRVLIRRAGAHGPVYSTLELATSAPGHPHIVTAFSLHRGLKRLEMAIRILKDPAPLLDVHLAFPFLLRDRTFRYEGVLSALTPSVDFLPGAYWDQVTVQNWVRISGGGMSLLWSSLDAPTCALGRLTEGYTSPAHSCIVPERIKHPPGDAGQLRRAWVYSLLCANNFGTNFSVSQAGSLLFRYSLTTAAGEMGDAEAMHLGAEAMTPCQTLFTQPRRAGHLPTTDSLLRLQGDYLALLALKRAEDQQGLIIRLWNPAPGTAESTIRPGSGSITHARLTSLTEDDDGPVSDELLGHDGQACTVRVGPRSVVTLRVVVE